ncbi:MAG: hypothetical protein LBH92_03510 [Bacteroidales bacterium]|jgi:hypothetical protein|nr:hypothetical protein [Bacteroidales bacterium]
MEKLDKLILKSFKWFFIALFAAAIIAVCIGATHQWIMAAICGAMAFVLHCEEKKERVNNATKINPLDENDNGASESHKRIIKSL